MAHINDIITHLEQLLEPSAIRDYCPNGLQVAGKPEVSTIITAVTASQALLEQAIAAKADAILVHHGYFWKGENPCLVGPKRARLKMLLQHEINLLAYHLPLDLHPELGNNAQLAIKLGIERVERFALADGTLLGFKGHLPEPMSVESFAEHIEQHLARAPQVIKGHQGEIQQIAWCTGAAQDTIEQAAELGVDAFLSGEISERTVHSARELGIHYIAAGHHATERYGVQAVGEHLAKMFGISHQYIELDNPV